MKFVSKSKLLRAGWRTFWKEKGRFLPAVEKGMVKTEKVWMEEKAKLLLATPTLLSAMEGAGRFRGRSSGILKAVLHSPWAAMVKLVK